MEIVRFIRNRQKGEPTSARRGGIKWCKKTIQEFIGRIRSYEYALDFSFDECDASDEANAKVAGSRGEMPRRERGSGQRAWSGIVLIDALET